MGGVSPGAGGPSASHSVSVMMGELPPTVLCAAFTILCRAVFSTAEQLLFITVMQEGGTFIVHL